MKFVKNPQWTEKQRRWYKETDERMDGQKDRWTGGQMDGQIDGWTD
jgi:hypothetical protein